MSDSHPRTKMVFTRSSASYQAFVFANSISTDGGTVRVKGDGNDTIVTIDKSIDMGGKLGRMQVLSNSDEDFISLMFAIEASSELVVDSGIFLGKRQLVRFKTQDIPAAILASINLCG